MWAQRMSAPRRFERVEVPAPVAADLAEGQVLLRVLAGGICGSDLPRFRGHKGANVGAAGVFLPGDPGFPMHEVVGEVVASRHPDVRAGRDVVGWATGSDAIAEYVVTDGGQVNEYAVGLAPEQAVLIQPLACVLYPLRQAGVAGARVTVLGLGPIGLLFAHALREEGAAHVTGVDPVPRDSLACRFGLDRVVTTTSGNWAAGVGDDDRPDLVIEAVGHQVSTLQHAIEGCATGGRITYFGIPDDDFYPLDMERLMRKNLTLAGGVTRDRRRMLAEANDYLLAHPALFDDVVTDVVPVDQVQRAFDLADRPAPDRLKVVVTM
jgi:threonine dehydrogenase-like Zn-dependent dehydrogenase